MRRHLLFAVLAAFIASATVSAATVPDEEDYDESIRLPVRRLHPERANADWAKKMQKDMDKKKKKNEEKQRKEEEKQQQKNGEKKIVATRQMPASTADKSLMQTLLSKDYSLKKFDIGYEEPKPITWKDDPVSTDVNALMAHVSSTARGGATLYAPKGVSLATNTNEVFFCFEKVGNTPRNLRLRVQYYADDPLNYNNIQFTIDGFKYDFHPASPSRGKDGSRMYWELSDDALTASHKDLAYALSHCHWARISLMGDDGMNHVKMLSKQQLEAFARTFELYRALGGTFN